MIVSIDGSVCRSWASWGDSSPLEKPLIRVTCPLPPSPTPSPARTWINFPHVSTTKRNLVETYFSGNLVFLHNFRTFAHLQQLVLPSSEKPKLKKTDPNKTIDIKTYLMHCFAKIFVGCCSWQRWIAGGGWRCLGDNSKSRIPILCAPAQPLACCLLATKSQGKLDPWYPRSNNSINVENDG